MAAEPSPAASDGEDAARTSRACLAEAEAVLNCIAASQREYAENPRKHDPGRCNDTFARFMRCTHVNNVVSFKLVDDAGPESSQPPPLPPQAAKAQGSC